ncbi:hypothetical protein OS42_34810 [Dickeya oryzae]
MDDIASDDLLNDVKHYWNNRAQGYNDVNVAELACAKRHLWQSIILRHAPKKNGIKYTGCGHRSGFFCRYTSDGRA